MNTTLWILQILMAFTFMYSGIHKSIYSIPTLVNVKGQTGVDHLPLPLVRFIGFSEILGAVGIILPWYLQIIPILTPITSLLFALIMIPAAVIHYKRQEPKNVLLNSIILLICVFIAIGRIP